jgi:serpin B
VLGYGQGEKEAVDQYCLSMLEQLPNMDKKTKLTIANALFADKDMPVLDAYKENAVKFYKAEIANLDFSNGASSLKTINDWCSKNTNGMIPKILDEVNPDVVTYLLNAIYFKADWASKFDQKNTKNEDFTTENGSTKLPMMHQNVLISYLKTNIYSAVIIPYGSGLWNMTVLLPEKGKTTDDVIKEVAESSVLNNRDWCLTGMNTFQGYEVDLKLPRFETNSDTDELKIDDGLIGLMKKMGIKLAFDPDFAEIPNMCEKGGVYISMMRQKAAIKVNEEGSEAAAVTIAGANYAESIPQEYPKAAFHANRPFVYVIREASSGVILFVGKFTGK